MNSGDSLYTLQFNRAVLTVCEQNFQGWTFTETKLALNHCGHHPCTIGSSRDILWPTRQRHSTDHSHLGTWIQAGFIRRKSLMVQWKWPNQRKFQRPKRALCRSIRKNFSRRRRTSASGAPLHRPSDRFKVIRSSEITLFGDPRCASLEFQFQSTDYLSRRNCAAGYVMYVCSMQSGWH